MTMRSIEQMSALIEAKELSPVELTEACLSRIQKQNHNLNAYVYVGAEEARAAATRVFEA